MNFTYIPILTILLFFQTTQILGQDSLNFRRNDAIYFELLGNGVFATFNYERRFNPSFCGRIGLGVTSPVPVIAELSFLEGKDFYYEFGLGVAFITDNKSSDKMIGSGRIGIRYEGKGKGKGLLLRLAFTPLFNTKVIYPWGGFSVGISI